MENRPKKYVIITAGGSGTRMGANVPKQMLEVGGKPILRWTIEQFLSLSFPVEIILVMNKDAVEMWREYCKRSGFAFKHILIKGGITRFHSVKNGLKYVEKGGVVAVHDGVRPFVSTKVIEELFSMGEKGNSTIPYTRMVESMREKDSEGIYRYADRDRYVSVQTPQVFPSDILLQSYEQGFSTEFTDDASVVEKAGFPLSFLEGNRLNIKITTPEDMRLAEAILSIGLDNL